MSTPVSTVLDRLEHVRHSGDGFTARCPAHDDDDPSLSVTEGDDGRVLVKCFAGCSFEEVVHALGVGASDLFPAENGLDPRRSGFTVDDYANAKGLPPAFLKSQFGLSTHREPGRSLVVAIPYRDAEGTTIRTRYRTQDRFWWGSDGSGLSLYGLDRLASAETGRSVLLVEGESDVHAAAYHDVLAVGVPGASSWRSSWTRHLEGRDVFVWREPDQGGDNLVQDVADDLPRAQVISAPEDAEDPSALHLLASDAFRDRLRGLTRSARPIQEVVGEMASEANEPASTSTETPSTPLSKLYVALEEGPGLEYDLKPYTAQGRFTLISAPPKRGKSTFAALYAHAKATGGEFLGQKLEPANVLYVAPDENWRDVVRRFRSFGTPGDRLEVWRDHQTEIARIAARAAEISAGLVVLDTLLRVAGISDENDNAAWDRWFGESLPHVRDSDAVWAGVHHDRKSGGKDGEAIRGASAIFGSVEVAVSLQKSDESPRRRILRVEGSRLDMAEPLVIELDADRARYDAVGEQHVVSILEDAALERLRKVLTTTPQPVAEIHEAVKESFPDEDGDVAGSTIRDRLKRLRSAGLAARTGNGGRRDPYRYSLNRSADPDRTTERDVEVQSSHDDTRSAEGPEDEPSAAPSVTRSIVREPRGAERPNDELGGPQDGLFGDNEPTDADDVGEF